MPSQVEIVNYAGIKLGAEATLMSIDDNNKLARCARATWRVALEATLAAHPWNFAMARASLPALTQAPEWGYERAFERPSDMLRLYEVNGVYVWNLCPGEDAPYSYEGDAILTNLGAPLRIRYIRRVDDAGMFSPGFVEALACKLAQEMALQITENATTREQMGEAFKMAVAEAKGSDGRENPPELPAEDDWILARGLG